MIRQIKKGRWAGMWIVTLRSGNREVFKTKDEAYRAWRDSIGRIQFASAGAKRER